MKDSPIKNIIIGIVIVLVFIGVYFLLKYFTKEDLGKKETFLKNYKVNEYIPTYISDEDMAKIYLNDYIHNMYYDVNKAYDLLDNEYKNAKFGSLESYKNYVKSLNYKTYKLARYYKKEVKGSIIFGVYDENSNLYIFKTNGVMQYTVYLDDYTVEI